MFVKHKVTDRVLCYSELSDMAEIYICQEGSVFRICANRKGMLEDELPATLFDNIPTIELAEEILDTVMLLHLRGICKLLDLTTFTDEDKTDYYYVLSKLKEVLRNEKTGI